MFPLAATALSLAFPALTLFAAAKDATSFRIPNWISLALAVLFPAAALAVGMPITDIGLHLAIGTAALVLGMVMFALRWLGGGDAKLMAAAALWLGWPALMTFLAGAALAGGVLAVLLLALRSPGLRLVALRGPPWMSKLAEPGEGVPYGVAIAAGVLAAFPLSPFGLGSWSL
ncbi:prepilin peptidase [uncultured Phenylobacterium sp.]|uniref:A24 family peptidase n=1 Tax=uncultured Phenylobacterium sp. TaxID=349273 RepID=UPI0025D03A1C|nr:prepilin peptidase [uncultured Phenylobacterium sp.]